MDEVTNRLRISYELEDGPTVRTVELPFSVGVLADLSGDPLEPREAISDRSFVGVTRDSIDDLIRAVRPRLTFPVSLTDPAGSVVNIELTFNGLDDFSDPQVVRQLMKVGIPASVAGDPATATQILQHRALMDLRTAWVGLGHLCDRAARFADVQVHALNITKAELEKTLRQYRGSMWDKSPVFKKLFDERLAAHGGIPFGCLLGGYSFDHSPADVETLKSMSQVASAAHCPFLTAVSPRTAHLHRWTDLRDEAEMARLFDLPEYAAWREWQQEPESRFVTLISCASGLGADDPQVGLTDSDIVFDVGGGLITSFGRDGSWRQLGAVLAESAKTSPGRRQTMTERQIAQLQAVGIAWMGPGGAEDSLADSDVLARSLLRARFQHCVRAYVRDTAGTDPDVRTVRHSLLGFLSQFLDGSPDHSSESMKAGHPLREIDVDVTISEWGVRPKVDLWLTGDPIRDEAPRSSLWNRTRLTYVVEGYGTETEVELPFTVGVIGDFSGSGSVSRLPLNQRRFVQVSADSLDDRMRAVQPSLAFHVQSEHSDGSPTAVALTMASLDDLSPRGVVRSIPEASSLFERRESLSALLQYTRWNTNAESTVARFLENLSEDVSNAPGSSRAATIAAAAEGFDVMTDAARTSIADGLALLTDLKLSGTVEWPGSTAVEALERVIRDHDDRLSRLVNAVMHHPDFQRLERTWLGLKRLVAGPDSSMVQVRMLDISEAELRTSLLAGRTDPVDAQWLYRAIHAKRGRPFGEPIGCVVGDFAFDHTDVDVLSEAARIGAATVCPFVFGTSPTLLYMDSWLELSDPRDLQKIFSTPDFAPWRALREKEESRFLVLALPRFLGRRPFDQHDDTPGFRFEEASTRHEDAVWLSSAFAVGMVVKRSFGLFGWPGRIAGVQTGGTLRDVVPDDDRRRMPTEVAIGDRRLRELDRLGLAALAARQHENCATFFEIPTLRATSDAARHAVPEDVLMEMIQRNRLRYVLMESRIAQYVFALLADKAGSFRSANDVSQHVQDWLAGYVNSAEFAGSAERPLAGAETDLVLRESDGTPTHLRLSVRPGHQMEPLTCATTVLIAFQQGWLTKMDSQASSVDGNN